jgi:hypothetical protein
MEGTLFRANTMTPKLFKYYAILLATPWLWECLAPYVWEINESGNTFFLSHFCLFLIHFYGICFPSFSAKQLDQHDQEMGNVTGDTPRGSGTHSSRSVGSRFKKGPTGTTSIKYSLLL